MSCTHPADRKQPLFPARDYITGNRFTVVRCTECGLARTTPVPAGEDLDRYYPGGYYGSTGRYPAALQFALRILYSWRARRLERLSGVRSGFAVDIGCGPGWLLGRLRARGWKVVGTELNDESAVMARALGLEVRTGVEATHSIPSRSQDVVILWHVLEHSAEPADLLREAERLLRPGGTLLVAVPNFGSPEARIGRDRWFHLDVPRHLVHFTEGVLRRLLAEAGFTVTHTGYLSPEYDLFSAVQTALNLLGIRQNLLYNLLRRRGARPLGERTGRSEEFISLALASVLAVLGLIWMTYAAATGRGATVTMYARLTMRQAESPQ